MPSPVTSEYGNAEVVSWLEGMLSRNVIGNSTAADTWNEDFITLSIIKELRAHNEWQFKLWEGGACGGGQCTTRVRLSPHKFKGPLETCLGDVGILVQISIGDMTIEGAALLEAKKIYKDSDRFEAMHSDQLRRIYLHSPHSMLLLYDYRRIVLEGADGWFPSRGEPSVYPCAVIVPINTALEVGNRPNLLYRFSNPLSYQLVRRYTRGQDLDFNPLTINSIKGFAPMFPPPRYVLCISVSRQGSQAGMPQLNSAAFEIVELSENMDENERRDLSD